MTLDEVRNRKLAIQKAVCEIKEILKVIKPGGDEKIYKKRIQDYQKQLSIFDYFENLISRQEAGV